MFCRSEKRTIGQIITQEPTYDFSPPYQREAGVWSDDKQRMLLDSILNGFDIPKIYIHDRGGKSLTNRWAIVDGKQRLGTIRRFVHGELALAQDFEISQSVAAKLVGKPPEKGQLFGDFDAAWHEYFKGISLDCVIVEEADEDDIEDLFSRLNNGEPLNAAEKRNAMNGPVPKLIAATAKHDFFAKKLAFKNKRSSHFEISAKFLHMEIFAQGGAELPVDLKKKHLDTMVKTNEAAPVKELTKHRNAVFGVLGHMQEVFDDQDKLLSKQAYPPMLYVFIRKAFELYASGGLPTRLHTFLESFWKSRVENNQKPEGERDSELTNWDRLMQQGTNDKESIRQRVDLLMRRFLEVNINIPFRDKIRNFTREERHAIWITGGRKCAKCKAVLKWEDVQIDHVIPHAKGGATKLVNAQVLCSSCHHSKS